MTFKRLVAVMSMSLASAVLAVFLLVGSSAMIGANPTPHIQEQEWRHYTAKFLEASGRIIDNANGNISHSEGQGYGMLLAYLADQPTDFHRIWTFTRTELLVRDDSLAAWRWEPDKSPHISDMNNATDGDILVAYALALAGRKWGKAEYLKSAARIATAVLSKTVRIYSGRTILLPGVDGFSSESRPDGPVVNPSYLILEAFPVLDDIVPSPFWDTLSNDGLDQIRLARFGPAQLPPEWLALGEGPKPAEGFDPIFSYNAIRIPLYLIRAGNTDKTLLERFRDGITRNHGEVSVVDLKTGNGLEALSDPGYRIIVEAINCVISGKRLQPETTQFAPVNYYPASLQLLTLAYLRGFHPDCLKNG